MQRRTIQVVALVSLAAMMLAAGLLLASCAATDDEATKFETPKTEASSGETSNKEISKAETPITETPNAEPSKSTAPKSEAVKDTTVQQPEPVKASEVQTTEVGLTPSEDQALREGKEEMTVLVLNACGVEGAAAEAADKVKALGFTNVTVGNASYYQQQNRVSYHHEEHRAEVEEVAALFEPLLPFDPYCYEDAWSGGWSMDYDILVMLGSPCA